MSKKIINAYNILLVFVFLLNFFAILAPVLLALGLDTPSRVIYTIYSFFCHQIHYRSLHIFDYQYAWCTRDMFIWFGMLAGGLALKRIKIRQIKIYEIIPFVVPIALDGGIQLIATFIGLNSNGDPFYSSTNLTRMITGSILGIGLSLWMFPVLGEFSSNVKSKIVARHFPVYKLAIVLFAGLFAFYFSLVGLWQITSSKYEPTNLLDSQVKLPEDQDEWLVRRQNGTCPVDSINQGILNFDCEE